MSLSTGQTEAEIWNRAIQPEQGSLTPDAARALLGIKLSAQDVDRINELSLKARDGTLTEIEGRELDDYLNVGRTLGLLKAKARISLRSAVPSS